MKLDRIVTDITVPGPWLDFDIDTIKNEFQKHIESCSFPEDFSGVVRGPIREIKNPEQILFVRDGIDLERKRRKDTMIPSSFCGPHPKWLHNGYLLKTPQGWLLLLGRTCGENHLSGHFHTIIQKGKKLEAEKIAQNKLSNFILHMTDWLNYADDLISCAEIAENSRRKLLQTNKSIISVLRRALKKEDGWLKIEVKKDTSIFENNSFSYDTINAARITGLSAVKGGKKSNLSEKLKEAIELFKIIGNTQEEAFEKICEAEKLEELSYIWTRIARAIEITKEVVAEITDIRAFFSLQNFMQIQKWAEHPNCNIEMTVEIGSTSRTLLHSSSRKRETVNTERLFDSLPNEPVN